MKYTVGNEVLIDKDSVLNVKDSVGKSNLSIKFTGEMQNLPKGPYPIKEIITISEKKLYSFSNIKNILFTEDMFFLAPSAYVKCVQNTGTPGFVVGKIYEVDYEKCEKDTLGLKQLSQRVYDAFNITRSSIWTCFVSSTKKEFDIQNKSKFKVGQWYKAVTKHGEIFYGKFLKNHSDCMFCASEHYITNYRNLEQGYPFSDGYDWEETSLDEIQFFLPDEHPEKYPALEEGKWYKVSSGKIDLDDTWYIKFSKVKSGVIFASQHIHIKPKGSYEFGQYSGSFGDRFMYKYAPISIDEIQAYLPDDHEDKIKSQPWDVGTYVVFIRDYGRSKVGNIDCIIISDCAKGKGCVCKNEGIVDRGSVAWFATLKLATEAAQSLKNISTIKASLGSKKVKAPKKTKTIIDVETFGPIQDMYLYIYVE